MCRLLGLIGPSLPAADALNAFYPLCAKGAIKCTMTPGHLDGWGISGFSKGRAVYFGRSAEPADKDRAAFDIATAKAQKSASPMLIAHFRKASQGARQINNTHPFHWRDWVFAHNGTLFNAADLKLEEAILQGETDSERLGLWLIERMLPSLDPTQTLVQLLKDNRARWSFSSLTFLLSDGKTLWAYRDIDAAKLEKGETVAERERYYTLHTAEKDKATIVCSEPLTTLAPAWKPLGLRALLVLETGKPARQIQI